MNHTNEHGHNAALLSTGSLRNTKVVDTAGVTLGKLDEIMLDVDRGDIAYAVLSFGGILGMGEKHFAVPWKALEIDTVDHRIVLDVDRERLENAPGFDHDNWPTSADETWLSDAYKHDGASDSNHGDTRAHADTGMHGDTRAYGDTGMHGATGTDADTRDQDDQRERDTALVGTGRR